MERKFTYITRELMERMTALRREFHRYPETAWTEYRTTWRAAQELKKAGFQVFLGRRSAGRIPGWAFHREISEIL